MNAIELSRKLKIKVFKSKEFKTYSFTNISFNATNENLILFSKAIKSVVDCDDIEKIILIDSFELLKVESNFEYKELTLGDGSVLTTSNNERILLSYKI